MTTAQIREEARAALEALAARNNGRLTADEVIAEAKPQGSPLHSYFTWDDREAARLQRLHEARELIRSVRVTTVHSGTVHRTIAFVRNPEKPSDEQGYIATTVLRTEADLARAAIVEEFGRAAAAMRRALAVADALRMRDDVQDFVDRIQAMKSRVEQRVHP